jgi:glycogen synthase
MKILIVSKSYPPDYSGGYEVHCSQVAEYLHRAGHEVRVLTSSYRLPTDGAAVSKSERETIGGVLVQRSLCYHGFDPPLGRFYTLKMAKRQLADAQRFLQILHEFQPDIVNWWNMEGLTKTILRIPSTWGIPDVYWVDDTWMIDEYGVLGERESLSWFRFWRGAWGPSFLRPLLRWILAGFGRRVERQGIPTHPFPICPRHVCFLSEFMRLEHAKAGLIFSSSEVIYYGVPRERFQLERPALAGNGRLRFLYAGYLNADRGLHIIIEALGLLKPEIRERTHLSIAQSGPHRPTEYVEQVKKRIHELHLNGNVTFLGKIQHNEMPEIYRHHDVLIFASTRREGLGMVVLEAMCAGCAVITTGSGGAIEIADLADLPIFPKDHPLALSRLIAKLVGDPELVSQIAERGQNVVRRKFTFASMMEYFGNTLHALYEGEQRQAKHDAHPAE